MHTFQLSDLSGLMNWLSAFITPDGRAYAYGYVRTLSQLYLVDREPRN